MNKIKRVSQLLAIFFQSLCWILPILTTYVVFFHLDLLSAGWGTFLSSAHFSLPTPHSTVSLNIFSWAHQVIIFLIECIPLTLQVLIFHRLAKLFQLYAHGQLFEKENIECIRQIGIYMAGLATMQVLYQALITLALTFNNPVGERFISISFNSTNLSTCMTGIVIWLASWIVQEANQLQTDAKLTI